MWAARVSALCASAALLFALGAAGVENTQIRGEHPDVVAHPKTQIVHDAPARLRQLLADMPAATGKVCGEIFLHHRIKESVRHLPEPERRAAFAGYGIDPVDLDSELVALYVTRQLDAGEIEAMRGQGARIMPRQYVPPVEGRHPHGYYLASIDYAAIPFIEADDRFVRVASVETMLEPMNDLGLEEMNAHLLHKGALTPEGKKVSGITGFGVGVAVADSGVDLSHPDLPVPIETFDVTTGDDASEWSTNVANTVIFHGTHVAGSAVGSGAASGGKYAGGAPGADFYFYKIGNNTTGSASNINIIKAINRAVEVGSRIFTLSYGGFDLFMDGSTTLAQAFDNAYAQGLISFSSAGNMGARRRHHSLTLEPNAESEPIELLVANPSQSNPYTPLIFLRVLWRVDSPLGEDAVELNVISDLEEDEDFQFVFYGVSPRGTEAKSYFLAPNIEPDGVTAYHFTLSAAADLEEPVFFHLYQVSTNNAIFPDDDPFYTVTHPANADTVVAVGAWRHRPLWIDYFGNGWFFQSGGDILAPFSSRGPRIDGLLKPQIVAPGSMTISLRDPSFANFGPSIISSTGINDGNGPAHYYVAQGTSMASPIAAGAMALLLEHEPSLTPDEAVTRITSTASDADDPNPLVGHGMMNMLKALGLDPLPKVPGDLSGDGTVGVEDLLILLGAWGACESCNDCPADLTGDCNVGVGDLLILLANWG